MDWHITPKTYFGQAEAALADVDEGIKSLVKTYAEVVLEREALNAEMDRLVLSIEDAEREIATMDSIALGIEDRANDLLATFDDPVKAQFLKAASEAAMRIDNGEAGMGDEALAAYWYQYREALPKLRRGITLEQKKAQDKLVQPLRDELEAKEAELTYLADKAADLVIPAALEPAVEVYLSEYRKAQRDAERAWEEQEQERRESAKKDLGKMYAQAINAIRLMDQGKKPRKGNTLWLHFQGTPPERAKDRDWIKRQVCYYSMEEAGFDPNGDDDIFSSLLNELDAQLRAYNESKRQEREAEARKRQKQQAEKRKAAQAKLEEQVEKEVEAAKEAIDRRNETRAQANGVSAYKSSKVSWKEPHHEWGPTIIAAAERTATDLAREFGINKKVVISNATVHYSRDSETNEMTPNVSSIKILGNVAGTRWNVTVKADDSGMLVMESLGDAIINAAL